MSGANKMYRPSVAIIGCGLIGALWDKPDDAKDYSLTHAAGFSKNPDCDLLAFVDHDISRAEQAAQRWGVAHAYDDVARMLAVHAIDIVVIAAASQARLQLLPPVLAAGVKLCVIEKPLATTLEESRQVVAALAASDTASLVNYSRHWDSALLALRDQLQSGELGQVQRLQAWYGKGISNNGSHMIDLVGMLLGAKPVRVRGRASPLAASEAAWSEGKDIALDAQIIYRKAAGNAFQLDMLATDQSAFTCFELRIVTRDAIVEMSRGGRSLQITPIVPDPNYANYRIPGEARACVSGNLQAMDKMVQEAVSLCQQIARGEAAKASCDAADALLTALTVQALKQSLAAGEIWQTVDN